jgi:hypothetical protein
MKYLLLIGGACMFFIGVIPLKRKFTEYDTQKNGEIISATITHIPDCFGTGIKHFLEFKYANTVYSKRIGEKSCEDYKRGEVLKLKHIEGTTVFLYENEKIGSQFISLGILTILGASFIIYGLRKK